MNQNRQIYRGPTEDFPLSVSFFSPLIISPRGAILKRDAHANFEFLCIRKGLVQVDVDGQHYVCSDGDYVFLSPWQTHGFHSLLMDTHYINLRFPQELLALPQAHLFQTQLLQPLMQNQMFLPQIISPSHPVHHRLDKLTEVLDPNEESDAYKIQLLSMIFGIFAALLPYCTHLHPSKKQKQTPSGVTRQVMQFIRDNYSQRLNMDQIAQQVHLHPNYLSVVFRKITGSTVMSYLNQVRLSKSCNLLRHTNLPINQIAELCGFQSASFFTRRFQQEVDCTPRAYRNQQPPER